MPAAVVLDFDGVVLESVDIKTRAFEALFADHPEHRDAIVRLHVENAGMSRYEKFRRIYRDLLQRPLDDTEMDRLDREFRLLVEARMRCCPFVPGAAEFVEWVRARVPVFVASGTPSGELRDIIRVRGLDSCFAGVFGSPASKAELLRQIASRLGAPTSALLMVGDGVQDFEGAAAVGARFVGRVPAGAPNPFPAGPLAIVEDLHGLRNVWPSLVDQLDQPI